MATDYLLKEDGGYLLQESGYKIIIFQSPTTVPNGVSRMRSKEQDAILAMENNTVDKMSAYGLDRPFVMEDKTVL